MNKPLPFSAPHKIRRLICGAAALFAVAFLSSVFQIGCATRIIAPTAPAHPVPVFVADYGKHSSVVLPAADGTLVEYSFGDWDYMAEGKDKWNDAITALFFSRQATLARRQISADPGRDGANTPEILQRLAARRIMEFPASRQRVDQLMRELDDRFHSRIETMVKTPDHTLDCVYDPDHYGIANNCNQHTARWLAELGCEIDGPALLSNFRVIRPDGKPTPAFKLDSDGQIEPINVPEKASQKIATRPSTRPATSTAN